ncbi:MAG TPA: ferritin-like domain-containing protein [Vicinamibacterales bacterium]|nr:ferritin-like domain-containing protein [Vicinamibacterales bacterium]
MTLHELLVDEIKDLYHAEKQLTKALPKMAKAASHEDLREAFKSHLEETRGQIGRLEEVFAALDEKVKAKPCAGMAGILEEGSNMMEEDAEASVMDAGLIAAAQRAEHYEITAYGTCVAWARLLGLDEVAELLEQNLEEEKAADQKLSALAESEINAAAVAEGQPEEGDDEDEEAGGGGRSSGRSGGGRKAAAKKSGGASKSSGGARKSSGGRGR